MKKDLYFHFIAILIMAVGLPACREKPADPARVDHFKGEKAESLGKALAILTRENAAIEQMLARNLQPADLASIHEKTYSMENALERVRKDLEELAASLEEVHLSSETGDAERTREKARIYLDRAREIAGQAKGLR